VTRVRAGTWNVHGFRAGVEPIARVVRTEGLDLLFVQESGPRRRLRELGERLGWVVCGDPRAFPRRRIRNAVLFGPDLGGSVRSGMVRFEGAALLQPRGALIVRHGDRRTFASIHLGLDRHQRLRHARQLLAALDGGTGAVVIGGDMNAHPDDPATEMLAERYPDVWSDGGEEEGLTMPAADPTARIDYLFASHDVIPMRSWTAGDATMSDHLLVATELELPG
jgi:endonuclease/exonuclease/phosphatase family metal-dependent hydrolase